MITAIGVVTAKQRSAINIRPPRTAPVIIPARVWRLLVAWLSFWFGLEVVVGGNKDECAVVEASEVNE